MAPAGTRARAAQDRAAAQLIRADRALLPALALIAALFAALWIITP